MIERLELWWQRWVAVPRPPGKLDALIEGLHRWTRFQGIPQRPVLPTISVGGLTVGGAGKTPFTIWLTQQLLTQHSVAVISRGYRRTSSGQVVVSTGKGPAVDSKTAGDEPWLISSRCPQAVVICDQNRAAAIATAKDLGATIAILDDGFQHCRLMRDVDIVCLARDDLQQPYRPFPLGRWREPLAALQRASALIVFDVEQKDMSVSACSLAEAQFRARSSFTRWIDVGGHVISAPLPGARIAVCAAIARPERFLRMLQQQGYQLAGTLLAADHCSFKAERLRAWCEIMVHKGAETIVTTEKDYVKGLPVLSLPVIYPELELFIDPQEQFWEMLRRKIDVKC